ncbi:MAG TPA: A/G-specific adenine glycosylase [Candidatus Dormibacteraeota bacterium]|nr:A/G-specific adenine glycosylase [Candidatus Dormibacteraeota bacterium]
MLSGPNLRAFRKNLLEWFGEFQRALPWRENRDPYRVWLSEIMLQQTRVAAVIPYYEKFLRQFPTVRALAAAQSDEVMRHWSGLGYYSRARNLQRAARQIVAKHEGNFPSEETAVRELAGIGDYTSAAILSIAFEQPFAVLDGNVARVIARIFAMRGDLREQVRWKALHAHATQLLEARSPGNWNQAMMELGATICTPRAPQCLLCPVAKFCAARKQGVQEEIPQKRNKRAPVAVKLASAVFLDGQGRTVLLSPAKSRGEEIGADHVPTLVSRMLHFPTIAVTADAEAELTKYLVAERLLGRRGKIPFIALPRVRHSVTYRQITIFPFCVSVAKLPTCAGGTFVGLEQATSLAISNLTRKIARVAANSWAADRD